MTTEAGGRRRTTTYCRICPATCGLVVDVEDNRVVRAVGDTANGLTRGFSCPKGRHIGDFLSTPDRHRTSLKRVGHDHEPIEIGAAISEIATKLQDIVAAHGPESVALFSGTQSAFTTLTGPFAGAWWRTVGSPKSFGTMTIDQSAMWVADGRMGMWAAGRQDFDTSDVWMLVGTNPAVSLQGGDFTGVPIHDPMRRMQEAKARGLTLIVVDPRRTEMANLADIHLQLRPGTDATLFGGLLHIVLREGLQDDAFVERWVDGLDTLRASVAPFTPELVAERCGLDVEEIEAAALAFGRAKQGMALSGTGPDMGPDSNIAEHLIRALNVVCGRYPQEGEPSAGRPVLGSPKSAPGMAIGPDRTWERGYRSRTGFGTLKRQLPTPCLPDEILTEGPDRVRALFVSGGNPAAAIPDPDLAVKALSALDLLVTVDPFPSETARLAHYVIAPYLHLERPDLSRGFEHQMAVPFAMWTDALVEPPPDTIDDWQFWLRLAWEGGHTVSFAGRDYPPGTPMPTTEELLASMATRGRVSLDEVKQHPSGKVYEELAPPPVGPPADGMAGRFELVAPDVAEEIAGVMDRGSSADDPDRPFRLIVRRTKETINTMGKRIVGLPKHPYNPCFASPADLDALGVAAGSLVTLASAHGTIQAVVEPDATLRTGVLSMTHGFGGLRGQDDDPLRHGANVGRLLSLKQGAQTINGMPQMSAVAVSVTPA